MDPIGLSLIVVRSREPRSGSGLLRLARLSFTDEQHGTGPQHLSATLSSGVVFELYPAADDDMIERGSVGDVRLGFRVEDVADVIKATTRHGGTVVSGAVTRGGEVTAVVADPEGRRVEISSAAR